MQLINLTPHAITVINPTGGANRVIPASGTVARMSTTRTDVDHVDMEGFALVFYNTTYDTPVNLPDPTPGVRYIVSALIRTALPTRTDLISPADFVRDEKGQILGCRSFDIN